MVARKTLTLTLSHGEREKERGFEFDLRKMKGLLGYEPRHDVESVVETAEAIRRGEETGVVPTGIRYGGQG